MGKRGGDDGGMAGSLDFGALAAHSRRSWDLAEEEAELLRLRKLKGCPVPLPDAAKFAMYQELGLSDKGLDKTVQRFVTFWPEGAAKTHGPCFRMRTGANMQKLLEHWPACPTKHGAEVLPAPQDQVVQHIGDLMDAMQQRRSSERNPWPLDAHGFPDWSGVTDGLRGPPGNGFYPVHPTDVEQASEIATRQLASKLMCLLEQTDSQMGSVGAALRIVAQSPEGEALGITGRAVMAKFLRRRAEPAPDPRTGGIHATEIPESALWSDADENELAWVEGLAEQATAALGELYQRKLRAIREGGVETAASVGQEGRPVGDDERERRRQQLQRRRHLSQRPRSAAAAFSMGSDQPSTWQKEYGETAPSVNKALLEVRRRRGASAWHSVRHIAGVGGAPASRYNTSRKNGRSPVVAKSSRPDTPPRGGEAKSAQMHGSTVEEEEQLDATLEDMFDIDASRTFFMNRIPRVLTPGASYFDRSEGTVMPTPLESFHTSRSWSTGHNEGKDASLSVLQQRRPMTASGATSSRSRRSVSGNSESGSSFLAPTASSQAHSSGRGRGANKRHGTNRASVSASMKIDRSVSSSTLQLGTEDLATGHDIHTSSSFWELYDDSGAAEKAPAGPEPAGTQSSRHGFLAGESSWSNRASVPAPAQIDINHHNFENQSDWNSH